MKIVLQALMDCAIFFELSADETVDPDAAVQQLEEIQASLLELSGAERATVLLELEQLAKVQGSDERNDVVQRFVDALKDEDE